MTDARRTITPRIIFGLLVVVVIIPLLPLLISGRWDWWEAWVFAVVSILGFIISRVLAARKHPDIIAERARWADHADAAAWDKVLAPLVGVGGGLVPLVAGLDARYGWSAGFNLTAELLALILVLGGYALGAYALIENRFFSGVVRIQTERGHQVVSSGPYAWMRHPGYAGALLWYVGAPVLLDSAWTFVPAVFLTVVLVVRTRLEDRTLQAQLPGYKEYAQRVRYRLLPGVW